jgi:hypothetical protein
MGSGLKTMRLPRRHTSRTARASATLTVLTVLLLAATGGLALAAARTKSCATISNCATVVSSTPPPTATLGGAVPPASRFGVTVRTAPTSTLGTASQPGKLVTNAEFGRHIRCNGYSVRAPATFEFMLLTATPVHITYEITDKLTNTTAQGIQFCLAANFAFKTASGAPARAARLPDGTRGHVGLLPMCSKPLPPAGVATAPCLEQITTVKDSNSSTGVDVILKVRVPTTTKGDPWGAG